jgi:hypothetical protein
MCTYQIINMQVEHACELMSSSYRWPRVVIVCIVLSCNGPGTALHARAAKRYRASLYKWLARRWEKQLGRKSACARQRHARERAKRASTTDLFHAIGRPSISVFLFSWLSVQASAHHWTCPNELWIKVATNTLFHILCAWVKVTSNLVISSC